VTVSTPRGTRRSVDQVRAVWRNSIVITAFVLAIVVLLLVLPAVSHTVWLAAIVILGSIVVIAWLAGKILQAAVRSISRRFALVRQAARPEAEAAGWNYTAEGPAPSRELAEAVFMQSAQALRADHTIDVFTGEYNGYPFAAAHIDGYTTGFGGQDAKGRGPERAENVVVLTLPGLLPELKLKDRTAPPRGDYGLDLPVVASGNAAVDARWEVQSSHPDAARSVLTSDVLDYLASVPDVPCTIVFRNGQLIACRDPEATFASISQRLEILTGIARRVPEQAWDSVTPEVAGRGAYPILIARVGVTAFQPTRTVE
jgi:hypothetical protein